jgi:hypothetical protein
VGEARRMSNNGSIAGLTVDLYLAVGVKPPGIQGPWDPIIWGKAGARHHLVQE